MNNVLTYKGYIGSVQFSAYNNVFFCKFEGINDLFTFEGGTVQELKMEEFNGLSSYQTASHHAAHIHNVSDNVVNNGHLFVANSTDICTITLPEERLLTYSQNSSHYGKFLNRVVYSHIIANCRFWSHYFKGNV